jgi:hypothetical protein
MKEYFFLFIIVLGSFKCIGKKYIHKKKILKNKTLNVHKKTIHPQKRHDKKVLTEDSKYQILKKNDLQNDAVDKKKKIALESNHLFKNKILNIKADNIHINTDYIFQAQGHVMLQHPMFGVVTTPLIVGDIHAMRFMCSQGIELQHPWLSLKAKSAMFEKKKGMAENIEGILKIRHYFKIKQCVICKNGTKGSFKSVFYTACPVCQCQMNHEKKSCPPPLWHIKAQRVFYNDPVLIFLWPRLFIRNIQVIAVPWFAVATRPRSGFLVPEISLGNGGMLNIPYYFLKHSGSTLFDAIIKPSLTLSEEMMMWSRVRFQEEQFINIIGEGSFKIPILNVLQNKSFSSKNTVSSKIDILTIPEQGYDDQWITALKTNGYFRGSSEILLTDKFRLKTNISWVKNREFFRQYPFFGGVFDPILVSGGILEGFISPSFYTSWSLKSYQSLRREDPMDKQPLLLFWDGRMGFPLKGGLFRGQHLSILRRENSQHKMKYLMKTEASWERAFCGPGGTFWRGKGTLFAQWHEHDLFYDKKSSVPFLGWGRIYTRGVGSVSYPFFISKDVLHEPMIQIALQHQIYQSHMNTEIIKKAAGAEDVVRFNNYGIVSGLHQGWLDFTNKLHVADIETLWKTKWNQRTCFLGMGFEYSEKEKSPLTSIRFGGSFKTQYQNFVSHMHIAYNPFEKKFEWIRWKGNFNVWKIPINMQYIYSSSTYESPQKIHHQIGMDTQLQVLRNWRLSGGVIHEFSGKKQVPLYQRVSLIYTHSCMSFHVSAMWDVFRRPEKTSVLIKVGCIFKGIWNEGADEAPWERDQHPESSFHIYDIESSTQSVQLPWL